MEIAKEVWDGFVKVSKLVVSLCGFPILVITFLNNCGANIDPVRDPSKTVYNRH